MKLKYAEIVELYKTLNRMSTLTGKAGLAIAKTKKELRPYAEIFDEQNRNLFVKYGDEKDGKITVSNENMKEFKKEFSALLMEEADVEICKISDFDMDSVYCEQAEARDYELFELMMVEKPEEKPEEENSEESSKSEP